MKPGLLLNRDNDYRLVEKICAWIPFVSKVQASDVARAMVQHTIELVEKDEPEDPLTIENAAIIEKAARLY